MVQRAITDTLSLRSLPLKIPQLGFGVYDSPRNITIQSILTALKVGYRHIDTAQFYGNEAEVGNAVRQSGLKREKIFVVTKILSPTDSVEGDYKKCLDSVRKLDSGENGYVDLFLIHSPGSGQAKREQMWKALERLYEEGRAKSIGVSNFGIGHIEGLKGVGKVWPPHVNQLELHPWCQQREIVKYCENKGIAIQAYCPIVRNQKAKDPTVAKIAEKFNVTPNQILLRYSIQKNWMPLPKSDNPERIAKNADLYGFDLSADEMKTLDSLDQGRAGAICQAVSNN